jgi:hypothetical protein
VRPFTKPFRPGGAFRAVANRHGANAEMIGRVLGYFGSS